MGLRALAYYLDRHEAAVAQSVLVGAGMLAIIRNEDMLRALPSYTLSFGGYCLLVSELDLEDAIAVLKEARANPLYEGEQIVIEGDFLDRVLSLAVGWLAGGAPTPIRRRTWRDAEAPADL
jgi:hypothetical protein